MKSKNKKNEQDMQTNQQKHNDTTPLKETASDGNFKVILINISTMILMGLFDYFRIVGTQALKNAYRIRRVLRTFYRKVLKRPLLAIESLLLRFAKFVGKCIRFILFKVYMFLKFFIDAKDVIKNGFNKNKDAAFIRRLGGAIAAFFKGVYNNRRIFVTWINYLLPVAACIMLIYVIDYAASLNYAVAVEYNDADVGYVENEMVFERAENMLQSRVTYLEDDDIIDDIPKFTLAIVPENRLKDDLQLTDSLMKSSGKDIVKAAGLKIDDVFYGAVKEGHLIREALDDLKAEVKTPDATSVEFVNDVRLDPGLYLSKHIKNEQEIIELLTSKQQQDAYVNVLKGDTPILIAARNDLALDELVSLNPGILESCVIGRPVLVKKSRSYLPLSVTKTETYAETIPYITNTTKSTKLYEDVQEVSQKGVNGERTVVANVKYVDGIETSRDVVESNITKEMVPREVTVGTGGFPSYSGGGASSSGFIWPSSGGYVSSPFGKRGWSFHMGIDYATSYGTPVVAALPGRVVTAGWAGTYGNLVVIDHGGGLQTKYAHNSSLKVRVGQTVKQGDTIARVGSTGNSSGNHVHFEVRVNGAAQNPRNYLK